MAIERLIEIGNESIPIQSISGGITTFWMTGLPMSLPIQFSKHPTAEFGLSSIGHKSGRRCEAE